MSAGQDQIIAWRGVLPTLADDVYVAEGARIVGDVEIGPESSVWFNTVIRGDVNIVRIGARTNVQDNSMIHVTRDKYGTFIGDGVLIGHMCLLHACTLEDEVLVGMGSTIMDNVTVGRGAMIAAGSLVTPNKQVPPAQLWGGRPAKFMRDLSEDELAHNRWLTQGYVDQSREYLRGQRP